MVEYVCVEEYMYKSAAKPSRVWSPTQQPSHPIHPLPTTAPSPTRHLPAADLLQSAVPIPQHPRIKLRDLHSAARHHNEASLALGDPVVEVEQAKAVPHFVEQDVDVVGVEVAEDVVWAEFLTPGRLSVSMRSRVGRE